MISRVPSSPSSPSKTAVFPKYSRVASCQNRNKVALISGAGANTAPAAIKKLHDAGYKVIGFTSKKDNYSLTPHVHYYHVDRNQLSDPKYMEKTVDQAMKTFGTEEVSEVAAINLIGASTAPDGSTLKKINHDTPLAFFLGTQSTLARHVDKLSLVQVSSIAASINPHEECDYAKIKDEFDREVIAMKSDSVNAFSLRAPIVFTKPNENGEVDTGHAYSPEQLGNLPFIPVVGSGEQEVPVVAENCFFNAVINGIEEGTANGKIINAVSETIKQKDLYRRFSKKGTPCIHIPHEFAECIAKRFPKGRFALYAMRMFKTLDQDPQRIQAVTSDEFKDLLGRNPTTLDELYSQGMAGTQESPILEHTREIIAGVIKNPRLICEFSTAFFKSIPHFRVSSAIPTESEGSALKAQ